MPKINAFPRRLAAGANRRRSGGPPAAAASQDAAGSAARARQARAATLPADVQAVLISDGAGYHRSGELRCPPNVMSISLPPYSPELNPAENLGRRLRSHHWSNRT